MNEGHPTSKQSPSTAGCFLAVAIGFLTVAGTYIALAIALGPTRSIPVEDYPYLIIQVLLAASPFGFLALKGIKSKAAWIVGILLTVCFWIALFVSVLISVRDRTGANIGMGLILFLSPIPIAGAAWIADQMVRKRS